ncbi:TPA: dTDP-6-deoxy-L-hexose 3-O-methyltransferase [Escherichia coli]|nr:dTDP-6-deoxy-L-hexose 3-O-methyltransferase [Escherichia coli]HAW1411389.1 dTDP-6-deoxy-L-hexose 3-O-methyltransferase [Escherichia coli]
MTTFTDKELIKEIKERIGSLDVRDNIERRAYEIAQASLVSEPVAYQYRQWDAEYDEWGEWEDCGESTFERFVEEEKCLGAGVQTRKLYTAPPAHQPGGFTIEETQELYEDLVRSHISQALSGEKMKKKDRDADLRWIHGVIVQAAWFVKASLGQNA